MTRNLEARLARLEEAQGANQLPNGGILVLVTPDGKPDRGALERARTRCGLTVQQMARVIPIFIEPADAAL